MGGPLFWGVLGVHFGVGLASCDVTAGCPVHVSVLCFWFVFLIAGCPLHSSFLCFGVGFYFLFCLLGVLVGCLVMVCVVDVFIDGVLVVWFVLFVVCFLSWVFRGVLCC